MEAVGIALIVAGGLGNALDRFTLGYVVDFIDTGVISFPTFNDADIGVTCGFVLFFAGMLWSMRGDALVHEEGCAREGGRIGGEGACSGDDPLAGRR